MGNAQLLESMKYNLSYPSSISETGSLLGVVGVVHEFSMRILRFTS